MVDTDSARCFRGAVEVTVTGEPAAMGHCHCDSCRQWSAGPVNPVTLWKPEAVKVTRGADNMGSDSKSPKSKGCAEGLGRFGRAPGGAGAASKGTAPAKPAMGYGLAIDQQPSYLHAIVTGSNRAENVDVNAQGDLMRFAETAARQGAGTPAVSRMGRIGRTSMLPTRAGGIFEASRTASSLSRASIR